MYRKNIQSDKLRKLRPLSEAVHVANSLVRTGIRHFLFFFLTSYIPTERDIYSVYNKITLFFRTKKKSPFVKHTYIYNSPIKWWRSF